MKAAYLKKGLCYLKKNSLKELIVKARERLYRDKMEKNYESWLQQNTPTQKDLEAQRHKIWKQNIKFSVIVPAYRTPEKYFRQMLNSVLKQTYTNWELCIADGGGEEESSLFHIIEEYKNRDARIRYKKLERNLGIAGNTNEALAMIKGNYVVLLDHDDLLTPNALYEAALYLERAPETDILYSNEDKVSADLKNYFSPHLKTDFNLDLFRSNNYICHLFIVSKAIAVKVSGFRGEFNGAQDYDFILRCVEETENIAHIKKILYHWRSHDLSTAENPESKMYAYKAGKNALAAHLKRAGIQGKVENTRNLGFYRIRYAVDMELVSIFVYAAHGERQVKRCVGQIMALAGKMPYEIFVLVGKGDREKHKNIHLQEPVKVVYCDNETKSDIYQEAVKKAKGKYYIFMEDAVEIKTVNFLEILFGAGSRNDIGAVGIRMFSKKRKVVHSGISRNRAGRFGYLFQGMDRIYSGYFQRSLLQQNVEAVSGLLAVSRRNFELVGGFEANKDGDLCDIAFCEKIIKEGMLIFYEPNVDALYIDRINKVSGYAGVMPGSLN